MSKISMQELCNDMKLEVIYPGKKSHLDIVNSDINRPGLQLYGFYEYFDQDRVQIIGKAEWSYLASLTKEERKRKIDTFFPTTSPALSLHGIWMCSMRFLKVQKYIIDRYFEPQCIPP